MIQGVWYDGRLKTYLSHNDVGSNPVHDAYVLLPELRHIHHELFSFLSGWHIILGIASGSAAYHLIALVSILAQTTRDGSTYVLLAFLSNGPALLLICITPVLLFVSIRAIREPSQSRGLPY